MDFQILTDDSTIRIIAGIVIGILGFFFGTRRERKKNNNKKNNSDNNNPEKMKKIKTL